MFIYFTLRGDLGYFPVRQQVFPCKTCLYLELHQNLTILPSSDRSDRALKIDIVVLIKKEPQAIPGSFRWLVKVGSNALDVFSLTAIQLVSR